jgi:hypothetical protein
MSGPKFLTRVGKLTQYIWILMFPSFHSLGTKPWHIDELNIIVIGFDIVALSSFSILG